VNQIGKAISNASTNKVDYQGYNPILLALGSAREKIIAVLEQMALLQAVMMPCLCSI